MKHFTRAIGALSVATALAATFPATTSAAVPPDQGAFERATGLAVQRDGKIIGVGGVYGSGPGGDALVFRLNADGSRDPQFGIRPLDGPGTAYETATAAAVQPDGKIVVAGRTSKNDDGAVWRLLPSGARDLTFGGGDGFVPVDSGADEMLADVAIAPDGAIVVVGRTTVRGQATIYRLTPSGEFDATFDQDGALGIGGASSLATAVVVQPDGRILVAGYFTPADGLVVRRLTVGGAPDVTFGGGDGAATISSNAHADDLALQSDGRIVVAGRVYGPDGSDTLAVRYTEDGTVDPSFGSAVGTRVDLGG